MPQDDLLYKQLKERYQQMLQELFVHGNKSDTNVIAYRGNVWLLPDNNISPEIGNDILEKIGIDGIEYNEEVEFHDIFQTIHSDYNRADVLIGTINNKVLNLYSGSAFTIDPKSSILVKKIVQALKLQKVSYRDSIDDEEKTVAKKKITGQIPDYAYHGTALKYLESIMRNGLEPREYQSNYDKQGIYHDDKIFFSTRFGEASHHAIHTGDKTKSNPVILEFRIPDKNLIVPDYDIDVQSGETIWNNARITDTKLGSEKSDSLSQEFGIYGYNGKIIPQHIRYIYILPDSSNTTPNSTDYKRFTPKQIRKLIDNGQLADFFY